MKSKKLWIIGILLFGGEYWFSLPPIFYADGLIQVIGNKTQVATTMAILHSRWLLGQVLDELYPQKLANRSSVLEFFQDRLSIREEVTDSGILRIEIRGEQPENLVETVDTILQYCLRNCFQESGLKKVRSILETAVAVETAELEKISLLQSQQSAQQTQEVEKTLSQELELLKQKREEAARRLNPEHPVTLALDAKIASLTQSQTTKPQPKVGQVRENTCLPFLKQSLDEIDTLPKMRVIDFAVLREFSVWARF
ncbi:hypothetical protein CCP3SC1AL1_1020003 [Gammaproteobacteria bacterium]